MRKVNASSYNAFREQLVMEDLVKFTPPTEDKNGFFSSLLPLKPYNVRSIRDNQESADKYNLALVTKLQKDPRAKDDVKNEWEKLVNLGFLVKFVDLPKDVQDEINSNTRHFIAQTIAYKESSASTKTRICWDSSRSSKESASLNSILMKGAAEYSVAKMLIKFRENKYGISADISKFYNNLKLDAKHYHLHLAMWRPNLDPEEEAVIYVLLVHFYGIRSSGGLCLAAIKQIISFAREQNLEIIARILEAAYVDDCNSSVSTKKEVETIKHNMPDFMQSYGFPIKGLACSGEAPPKELSEDGISVNVAGYRWQPLKDELKIVTPKTVSYTHLTLPTKVTV